MTNTDKKKHPRKIARENGDRYYETGTPCVNGHLCKRATMNGTCVECAFAAAAKYRKKLGKKVMKTKKVATRIYKEVIITEEELKAESFKEMAERIYAEDRKW